MPSSARSIYSATVALAGAGAIALSPVSPVQTAHLPQIQSPAYELTAAPAFGANTYQALVNQFGNFLASYQIVVGGTQQCSVCLAPEGPGDNPISMSGWGTIGIGAGFINSWLVFGQALAAGEGLVEALGYAGQAIQTPITNTFTLITNDRVPFGGYQLADTLGRAAQAGALVLTNAYNALIQAFVKGPITIIGGTIAGLQEFAGILSSTGNFLVAATVGWNTIQAAITTSRTDLGNTIAEGRTNLYDTLTSGPTVTVNPIPIHDSEEALAEEPEPELANPAAALVRNSPKAIPNAAGSTAADTAAGDTPSAPTETTASGKSAKSSGTGGSARERTAAAG